MIFVGHFRKLFLLQDTSFDSAGWMAVASFRARQTRSLPHFAKILRAQQSVCAAGAAQPAAAARTKRGGNGPGRWGRLPPFWPGRHPFC